MDRDCPDQRDAFVWPDGTRAALSLSFDDGRDSQIDCCVPILDSCGVKGTIYICPGSIEARADQWRQAASGGHEIGNHTLTHPCSANHVFARDNALEDFTLERMTDEIDGASRALETLVGAWPTTFAYPCGETFVGRGEGCRSYVPLVAQRFVVGRRWLDIHPNAPARCDLAQVKGVPFDQLTFDQVKRYINEALSQNAWLILAGHDVGTDSGCQTVLEDTLKAVCDFATDAANGIWIDTVAAIGEYVREARKE